jgi:hypothetical protein
MELFPRVLTETPQTTYAVWFARVRRLAAGARIGGSPARLAGTSAGRSTRERREYRLAILDEDAARQWTQLPRERVRARIRSSRQMLAKLARSKEREHCADANENLAGSDDFDELLAD